MTERQLLEQILERLDRYEPVFQLLAAQNGTAIAPPESAQPRPVLLPVDNKDPYDLTDNELRHVESILPPEEGEIYRIRVMAKRLDKLGHRQHGDRMRRQADRKEKRLQEKRAA